MVREDAAQMCALQMQAEAGPSMLESPESLETAIERFIHKQVLPSVPFGPQILQCLLDQASMPCRPPWLFAQSVCLAVTASLYYEQI